MNGSEIENPIRVDSVSTLWKLDQVGEDTQSGFSERYICKANLTHLKSNTTYYYQAISNDVKSSIQSFTTASNDNSDKSFMFLTDIQSVGSSFKNAENLIQSILNATDSPDPNLVVMTGDQVDRGGYEQQWIDYYNYVPSLGNFYKQLFLEIMNTILVVMAVTLVMKFIINFTIILQMVQVIV